VYGETWVYILYSGRNGTLYIGVTNNTMRRTYEHKELFMIGFTAKYKVNKLVYFEEFCDIDSAIHREKCVKRWNREWKLALIERDNPGWVDLYGSIV